MGNQRRWLPAQHFMGNQRKWLPAQSVVVVVDNDGSQPSQALSPVATPAKSITESCCMLRGSLSCRTLMVGSQGRSGNIVFLSVEIWTRPRLTFPATRIGGFGSAALMTHPSWTPMGFHHCTTRWIVHRFHGTRQMQHGN